MRLYELIGELQVTAENGRASNEILVLDSEGFVHEIVSVDWDDESNCYFIRTEFEDDDT